MKEKRNYSFAGRKENLDTFNRLEITIDEDFPYSAILCSIAMLMKFVLDNNKNCTIDMLLDDIKKEYEKGNDVNE